MLALFCVGQVFHTLRGASFWPLSTYDMFSQPTADTDTLYRVVLTCADGTRMNVDPGHVVPVEFFRAAEMLARVYDTEAPDPRQQPFSELLLARLNKAPWRGFDEVFSAARAASPFVAMQVLREDVSLGKSTGLQVTSSTVLFPHEPP